MEQNRSISILNYIFIFFAVNYTSIIINYIHFDSANYGLVLLTLVVLAVNGNEVFKYLNAKPAKYWTIICFFSILNFYLHPHPTQEIGFIDIIKFTIVPWTVLGVSIKEYLENKTTFLFVVLGTLCFFAFMFVTTQNIYAREEGDKIDQVNEVATTLCIATFYMTVLNRIGKMKLVAFILLLAALFFIVSMTGCRKAFYSMFIISAFWAISLFNIRKFTTWIWIGAIGVAIFWGYNYLMDNMYIGQRIEMMEGQNFLPAGAPTWMTILGDRAPMYYYAPDKFIKSPLFGVGLRQTEFFGVYAHSELLAQLLDNGLVGFVLLICFYFGIVKGIKIGLNNHDECFMIFLGMFIALMFISITAWTWQMSHYFILFGVLIAYGIENERKLYEGTE